MAMSAATARTIDSCVGSAAIRNSTPAKGSSESPLCGSVCDTLTSSSVSVSAVLKLSVPELIQPHTCSPRRQWED
ncbi:hypothetical protein GCM10010492_35820 [Saccharothrix mutabilis subsp. mutabilis]|uniref:Uncharacterized protein n=1 Tax=Saccharothrix mutabilis subsp. mutabilis TaxID=66855 RepID=A0ABN0TZA7_9PSEU